MHGRDAEALVEQWLRDRGYAPDRFPLKRRKLGKTPDFRVTTAAGEDFLVEVKTLRNAMPSHGAVAFKLFRARAQFDAVNSGRRLANVLALVTKAPQAVKALLSDLSRTSESQLAVFDLVLAFKVGAVAPPVLHVISCARHAPIITQLEASAGTSLMATG